MAHREVGDGLVGLSGLDGWTNEMHCKQRFSKLFLMEKDDMACLHVEILMTLNGL
jgi:hypothetical protein